MKKMIRFELIGLVLLLIVLVIISRNINKKSSEEIAKNNIERTEADKRALSEDFKAYWYTGEAEITSYQLQQTWHGETRNGHAVLSYVTESFSPEKQVKAHKNDSTNLPVLLINTIKTFETALYPSSIMSSTFYPVYDNQHALKTSVSIQEWHGHVYAQINNRERFKFTSHSYFQEEADEQRTLEKNILENEIWTKIRINPRDLPVGALKIIPSLEYLRLQHRTPRAYKANASLSTDKGISTYTLIYPELERNLSIRFSATFPYSIEGWTEEIKTEAGSRLNLLSSKAGKLKSLKAPYGEPHGTKNLKLQDSLGL